MFVEMIDFMMTVKKKLEENSFQNLIWLIDLFPKMCGFSYFSTKVKALYWIVLLVSTFYIYFAGAVVYQIYYANGFMDTLNSYFNILICILICNCCRWLLFERKGLSNVLELAKKNNDMAMKLETVTQKHEKLIRSVKNLVLLCFIFHFINEVIIYIPKRISEIEDFSVASCVGLGPLSQSPNKEICMMTLAGHGLVAIIASASYDATFLFLFAHTAAMFEILKEETMSLNVIAESTLRQDDTVINLERLKNLINRHSLLLHTVEEIQKIYSIAVGISFSLEAITMCLFFVLPLEVVLNFFPFLIHGLFTFFLYCYQGQKITTASEGFESAVYCCGWENFTVEERKMILVMLRQSQRPVMLKAASVMPICIYSFAYTLQSIYKFVTAFKI